MSEVIKKIQDMISAPSCCAELKAAGQAYLDAVGTEKEAAAKEKRLLRRSMRMLRPLMV